MWVNTMANPASSAAAITSASRREPPGWITAETPASATCRNPSAKGKKASEAATASCNERRGLAAGRRDRVRCVSREARALQTVHLAGPNTHGGARLGIDDGV